MSTTPYLGSAAGEWQGPGQLHLSWLPEDQRIFDYETSMKVVVSEVGSFATLTYNWTAEDEPHQGVMIVNWGGKEDFCDAAWVDSWHQVYRVMRLEGSVLPDGSVSFTGSYLASPPGPDWGWRIEIGPLEGDGLRMSMINISPEGVEEWAVEHRYTRV